MYLVDTITDKKKIKRDPMITMFVSFPEAQVDEADRLEVWGSSFKDNGDDCCEYRLMNGEKLVATRTMKGY
jgi:hypothetical protein